MTHPLQSVGSARWSLHLRWLLLGVMALGLMIPLGMVESVVRERHSTYRGVLREIAGLWSGEQVLTGPILLLPFTERFQQEEVYVTHEGERKTALVWKTLERAAVVLPRGLELVGRMEPSIRHRGIYEAQVYETEVRIAGHFDGLGQVVEALSPQGRLETIHWERAALIVGLSEPKGIVRVASGGDSESSLRFVPGSVLTELVPKGLHARGLAFESGRLDYDIDLVVRGSGGFRWTPVGERSRAEIRSEWPHPSFYGDLVPGEYEIDATGFLADWDLSHLIRAYPQSWLAGDPVSLDEVTTGVRLFEPVALYARVTRSVKYGLLFIALTFLSLGLIELVSQARVRLVQYLLIGLALAMFFLILIAFAEHLGFPLAYLIAAVTVVTLNSAYCLALLQKRSLAGLVTLVLSALYGVLYAILQAEDYALLSGTLLLVAALAATMYFTRRLSRDPGLGPSAT